MSITRHHSGRWYYQFDARISGQRQRANRLLPLGWTRAQADKYDAAETARLHAAARGVSTQQWLIDDAVLRYLREHAPTLKNCADLTGALQLMHPWYTGQRLDALPAIARQYAADHATTLSGSTVRNRLAYLRAACRWAWRTHSMGEHDPAERMQLPRAAAARQTYFERADMLRIARALRHAPTRAVVRVAFYTGLRLSEILRAKAVQSVGALALSISDSKNTRAHVVPVHPRIAHLVRGPQWPPAVHKSTASHYTKLAMQAVGLGHGRLHDLRHSAASAMINAGVDLYTVGAVLNHQSAASTRRYAHLATSKLAAAVAMIGQKLPPKTPEKIKKRT